jgi:hypothetical protein
MKQNRNIKTDDIFKIGINKSIQNGHLSFFQQLKDPKLASAFSMWSTPNTKQSQQYLCL